MENLSTEIWLHIFELACTDGGCTGAILSQTSTIVREVSAPARFTSVQLTSVKRVQKFLACFDSVVAGCRSDPPRIRHLLLSFLPGRTDLDVLEPCDHFLDYYSWCKTKFAWDAKFVDALARLFACLAPDLRTMTVLQHPEIPLPFVRCSFPALRALTLLHEDRMFLRPAALDRSSIEPSDTNFYAAGPPPDLHALAMAPVFPALERLYLVDGSWSATLPLWSAAAPRLAHLQVSSAQRPVCRALHDALLTPTEVSTFASLRNLVVSPQTGHDDQDLECAPDHEPGVVPIRAFGAFGKRRLEHRSLRVDVLPEPEAERLVGGFLRRYWYGRLAQEWQVQAIGDCSTR